MEEKRLSALNIVLALTDCTKKRKTIMRSLYTAHDLNFRFRKFKLGAVYGAKGDQI